MADKNFIKLFSNGSPECLAIIKELDETRTRLRCHIGCGNRRMACAENGTVVFHLLRVQQHSAVSTARTPRKLRARSSFVIIPCATLNKWRFK